MVKSPSGRSGRSMLGCLVPIVIMAGVGFYGIILARPWFRNQQFQDEMSKVASFQSALTDSAMQARVIARADSLGLPPLAKRNLIFRRVPNPPRLVVESRYSVTVELPLFGEKTLDFAPHVEEEL